MKRSGSVERDGEGLGPAIVYLDIFLYLDRFHCCRRSLGRRFSSRNDSVVAYAERYEIDPASTRVLCMCSMVFSDLFHNDDKFNAVDSRPKLTLRFHTYLGP